MQGTTADMIAVGTVTEETARFWFRSEKPGPHYVRLWAADEPEPERDHQIKAAPDASRDCTAAFTFPDDCSDGFTLRHATQYKFRISACARNQGHVELGRGQFITAPSANCDAASFSFAFMSCHQPFDEQGKVTPEADRMLSALEASLRQQGVHYLLMTGDQIYADPPGKLNLFGKDGPLRELGKLAPEEIKAAYYEQYKKYWVGPFTQLQRSFSTFCTPDDHEIIDNWGSSSEHQEPQWRAIGTAAFGAFFDYQGQRNLGPDRRYGPYHSSFRWGPTATFLLDLRSQRKIEQDHGQILGEAQFVALEEFLASSGDCGCLFVVCSVPPVFLPDWLVRIGDVFAGEGSDVHDRWNWTGFARERDKLLRLLSRHKQLHPRQLILILAGDIHQGVVCQVRLDDEAIPLLQFTSSPITNANGALTRWAAQKASYIMKASAHCDLRLEVTLLPGQGEAIGNPYPDVNVGLVEVRATRAGAVLRLKILAPVEGQDSLTAVFDSGELTAPAAAIGTAIADVEEFGLEVDRGSGK